MLKAVIYDMDGVIINTIPLGKQAEYQIFKKRGILITEKMYKDTIGLRENETIAYWCKNYKWSSIDQKEILHEYLLHYKREILKNGTLIKGVLESLRFFQNKNVKLALAFSSFIKQIYTIVEKFHLEKYFDIIYSAENEKYGKPHPGVYLTTAKKLQISPDECLAIEDSFNGVIAAKAARMKCLYIPLSQIEKRTLCIADYALLSFTEINKHTWDKLNEIVS